MKTKIVFVVFMFILGGCERKYAELVPMEINNIGSIAFLDTIVSVSEKKCDSLHSNLTYTSDDKTDTHLSPVFQLIKNFVNANVGNKAVLNTFEKQWWIDYPRNENIDRSESEVWLFDLSFDLFRQYHSNKNNVQMVDAKHFHELFDINPTHPYIFEKMLLDNQFGVITINVAEYPNYKLYSILTNVFRLECNYCEHMFPAQIQSLVTVSGDKIIDNFIVAYSIGGSWGVSLQFFFYDYSNEYIYIKQFYADEEWTDFTGYRIYQITSQGKFIRYYEQNGPFENDNEQGLVENHTREGKWVDMSNAYYLESEYRDGLPIGGRRYYRMIQEVSEEGRPILSSRRKGELLYTETYEDGRMVRREFVRE
jgi:hypothetical protein